MAPIEGPLLRLSAEGARSRQAVGVLEKVAPHLCSALRRGLPFLTRRTQPIQVVWTKAAPIPELMEELGGPRHHVELVTQPGRARAGLVLDRGAIALTLDGVLGGDGSQPPDLDPESPELSSPQLALVSRMSLGLVEVMSEFLAHRSGPRLLPRDPHVELPDEAAPVGCLFRFGNDAFAGQVLLYISKDALTATQTRKALPRKPNPEADGRLSNSIGEAEIELVAELAKMRIGLADLAELRVGDTLRLNVPVDAEVRVHAEGRTILFGRPTSVAGQIAVRVGRHEG